MLKTVTPRQVRLLFASQQYDTTMGFSYEHSFHEIINKDAIYEGFFLRLDAYIEKMSIREA